MGVGQSHECLRSSRRKVISTGTCLTLWRKPLTSNPRKGGCPVPTWAKRMVPCIIMMVDRWKVPDQIASEDPPTIGYRGRIRMKGKAGVITVHICFCRRPRCRCLFLTSSSGHAAARLSEPTRPSTPRCASWRVCRGSASSRRSATSRKHHLLLYIYLGPEQGTQNRDFMDNWTVHVTISSPGESQGTPGTALGLASWM